MAEAQQQQLDGGEAAQEQSAPGAAPQAQQQQLDGGEAAQEQSAPGAAPQAQQQQLDQGEAAQEQGAPGAAPQACAPAGDAAGPPREASQEAPVPAAPGPAAEAAPSAARGPPLVAGLLRPGGAASLRPEVAELVAKRGVSFHGEQMELVVASPAGRQGASAEHPATELDRFAAELDGGLSERMVHSCTWLWPLHDRAAVDEFRRAVSSHLVEDDADVELPIALSVMAKLFILMPGDDSLVVKIVRNTYGNRTAYAIFWGEVYVQQLWLLAILAAVALSLQTVSISLAGEVMNYGTLLWISWLLLRIWSHTTVIGLGGPVDASGAARVHDHRFDPGRLYNRLTWVNAVGVALLTLLFICLNVFAVLCYLQLMVWLWYDWGDCITLGCKSPDEKHGFIGVVAEILLDVGFALVIVMIRALANLFGSWAATWHNVEFAIDRRIIAKVYTMLVEAVDTIGPFLLFGLLFVTPWSGSVQHDLPEADCSDAMLYGLVGRSSFSCLVRRVSVENRRWVYRRMMRGPLMMAPFIRLLTKCVIPMVARLLNKYEVPPCGPCRCPSDAINALIRLVGLIFALDGDSVGGFRFVFSGDPFPSSRKAAEAPPPASADLDGQDAALADGAEGTEQLLDGALEEMKLKEFEVDEEVNEVKLSLLFLVMFGPIAPEGVFTTLLARMMESWFDLSKLLFLKRRPFPDQGMSIAVMHFRMKGFIVVTIVVKVVWSFVLSLVVFA